MQTKQGFPKWFLPIVLITVIIAGVSCTIQYCQIYKKNSEKIMGKELKSSTAEMMDEIEGDPHFAELMKWVYENRKDFVLPVDYKNDLQKSEEQFNTYMKNRYGESDISLFESGNRRLNTLDAEAQSLYVNYRMKYWYNSFAEMVKKHDLKHLRFLYPLEDKENTVLFLIDPNNVNIGEAYIDLYKENYLDPEDYQYLWKTWESGSAMDAYDGKSELSYTRPLKVKDEKIGLVQAIS